MRHKDPIPSYSRFVTIVLGLFVIIVIQVSKIAQLLTYASLVEKWPRLCK